MMLFRKDRRGWMAAADVLKHRFLLIFTKAGMLRGGDYHSRIQYDIIIKGEIEITYRYSRKEKTINVSSLNLVKSERGIPHLFRFLKNTLLIQIIRKDSATEFYKPYRKLI